MPVLAALFVLLFAGLASADSASELDKLHRTARTLAHHGRCDAVGQVGQQVFERSVSYFEDTFSTDPVITGCVAPDLVNQPDLELAPPSLAPTRATSITQTAAPAERCDNLRGYVEPALWGGGSTAELRHGFGLDAGGCQEVSLHLGVRLDVGGLGGFAGGEAELLFGRPGTRFGVNVTTEGGTASRSSVGARVRFSNVWLGADLMRTTPNDTMEDYATPAKTTTTMMFGFGLGGSAGKGFVKGELTALYVAARVLSVAAPR